MSPDTVTETPAPDYKGTLNLPETAFPMRAGLPEREPQWLARWARIGVYDRLRERGYEVFAVNPHAATIGDQPAYPSLAAIPGGVEAVVIGTAPDQAPATMAQAAELGIRHVWMHRSFGGGSVSEDAARYGREHGVQVIAGGCPLMFGATSDGGHRFMCRLLKLTGKVPRTV